MKGDTILSNATEWDQLFWAIFQPNTLTSYWLKIAYDKIVVLVCARDHENCSSSTKEDQYRFEAEKVPHHS